MARSQYETCFKRITICSFRCSVILKWHCSLMTLAYSLPVHVRVHVTIMDKYIFPWSTCAPHYSSLVALQSLLHANRLLLKCSSFGSHPPSSGKCIAMS